MIFLKQNQKKNSENGIIYIHNNIYNDNDNNDNDNRFVDNIRFKDPHLNLKKKDNTKTYSRWNILCKY